MQRNLARVNEDDVRVAMFYRMLTIYPFTPQSTFGFQFPPNGSPLKNMIYFTWLCCIRMSWKDGGSSEQTIHILSFMEDPSRL
jgi:hypothetical protein